MEREETCPKSHSQAVREKKEKPDLWTLFLCSSPFTLIARPWRGSREGHSRCPKVACGPFPLLDRGIYSRSRFSSAAGVRVGGGIYHSPAPHIVKEGTPSVSHVLITQRLVMNGL